MRFGPKNQTSSIGVVATQEYFLKNGFRITVSLINNRSVGELYENVVGNPLSEPDIQALLSINSAHHPWGMEVSWGGRRSWKRDDGALSTLLSSDSLEIKSKELIDAEADAYKKAHTSSVSGF